jgi:hypothetical protein
MLPVLHTVPREHVKLIQRDLCTPSVAMEARLVGRQRIGHSKSTTGDRIKKRMDQA